MKCTNCQGELRRENDWTYECLKCGKVFYDKTKMPPEILEKMKRQSEMAQNASNDDAIEGTVVNPTPQTPPQGQNPYGQAPQGQRPNPYGQAPQGNVPPQGQNPYGQAQQGQRPNPYGQAPQGNIPPQGQNPYGSQPNLGQRPNPYGSQPNQGAQFAPNGQMRPNGQMPFPQQGMPAMGANPIAQNEEQIKGGKQCTTCGKTIHQDAVACPKCGCEQVHTEHDSGVGAGIMGFLSVGAGLALNSAWKESKPKHAKSALIGAIAGIVARVGILGGIVALVFVYVLPFIASIPAIC